MKTFMVSFYSTFALIMGFFSYYFYNLQPEMLSPLPEGDAVLLKVSLVAVAGVFFVIFLVNGVRSLFKETLAS